ncbi:MAG TPA: serine/threonine-protein kinase [Bryobacteraceae bacterium]|nr:serine/threonine-protein kinase [Bryobacteraceae bacterium]
MDSARLKRIQQLFLEASELPAADRHACLQDACGGDTDLLEEVRAMLDADARSDSVLDGDLAGAARSVFEPGPSLVGQFLGPYRLTRLIGEGGMGVVYLAQREDLGSAAAIKILRDAWFSPARRERFESEQRLLAQLIHPSIARLYDADTLADGTPWFAMEYVQGRPITEYARERACSVEERLRLFRSVCEAVQYAHGHAIIHRDLKPSNILVKTGGEVRLLDFGIAKQLDDTAMDQTRTELRLMTPAYAAPEQLRGGKVGIFTDVYALGVLLYELLAGRAPFHLADRTPGEAEKIIVDQEPPRPSSSEQRLMASSWADLDVLCLTAMHKDPERRYRTVDALIGDVDRYLNREPLQARPDTLRYRAGKFVARNWRAVAASAIAMAVMMGLVVFFTVRLTIARNTAEATALRLERVQQFMLSLFEGGDSAAAPAEDLRVTTLIGRGYAQAKALQRDPEVQAELYQTLGGIYQKLGDLRQADVLLNMALSERKSLLGPQHPEVAESLIALGLLRVDQAKLDEAERLVREGLERTERMRPRDEAAIAKATTALGKVLEARGAYDRAIPMLDRAVQLQSRIAPASANLAAAVKELADAQFYAGHYDVCDTLNLQALALHRKIFGDHHPLVADDLINLGAVQFERAHYPEAEKFYRQALDINRAWYGNDHPEVASTLSMLGRALVFEKRYDQAVALVEQALAIQERVYGPAHPKVANVLNELGTVALQRERFDEAEARFRRMADIYKSAYGERHYLYALAYANLASVFLAKKDYRRAEPMFREAVQRYTDALSADHLYTGIGQIKWGRALAGEKRYADAETHLLAGYKILMKQASPSASWIRSARSELVNVYEALNEPDKAAQFRDVPPLPASAQ